jgi:hypothetical protein
VSTWQRHFFYRKQTIKTTWKLRLSVIAITALALYASRGLWSVWIGESLTCRADETPSDALLIENFDLEYLVFQRAAELQRAGGAKRALVPVQTLQNGKPSRVMMEVAQVMANVARIEKIEIIPIVHKEPITLNAARQIRDFLLDEKLASVTVVSPSFRSYRSLLIYNSVFDPSGIRVRCVPTYSHGTPQTWTQSMHGIQEVVLQVGKLLYYRFYVL